SPCRTPAKGLFSELGTVLKSRFEASCGGSAMFIQTEATPNPATLKFLPGREVLVGEPRDFRNSDDAMASPLASALFTVPGVAGVFLGSDFVSVTKDETADWAHIKPAILGAVMEHFLSGQDR